MLVPQDNSNGVSTLELPGGSCYNNTQSGKAALENFLAKMLISTVSLTYEKSAMNYGI